MLYNLKDANKVRFDYTQFGFDPFARTRISQQNTLGDLKILNEDKTALWENAGTGTGTFSNNCYAMSVTNGQWKVRQSKRFYPYFAGSPTVVECTSIDFDLEAGKDKRIGYFSSSTSSPYTADLDGFFVDNDGSTYWLRSYNAGTLTYEYDLGSSPIPGYDYAAFTVFVFDFLWLGGAALRLWQIDSYGVPQLLHAHSYCGTASDVFIKSPNQPVRYEIRSSSGSGNLTYICAKVATEGATNTDGSSFAINTGTTNIGIASIGTTYPLLGVRKKSAFRTTAVKIEDLSIMVGSVNDILLWSIQIDPVMSVPATWLALYGDVSNTPVQQAIGNGTLTVATPGRVVACGYLIQGSIMPTNVLQDNFLSYLHTYLDGTMGEYVVCGTPATASINTYASISLKEF